MSDNIQALIVIISRLILQLDYYFSFFFLLATHLSLQSPRAFWEVRK